LKTLRAAELAAAAALLFAACRAPAPPAPAPVREPDQVIGDFTIDSFEKGVRQWVLRSPRAEVFEADGLVDISSPSVRFYDGETPGSTLDAGRGRLLTRGRDMWAWDGVVMVSTDGARLTSEWLQYVAERDRIVSTAPVTIVRGRSVIQGVGWEAAPDLADMQILDQRTEIDDADRPKREPRPKAKPKKKKGKK
jgi:LPS export ABC transporter protein LptC